MQGGGRSGYDSLQRSLIGKPLQNEIIARCESQLSQSLFLKEFRTICDSQIADWQKFQTLYQKLAPHVLINVTAKSEEAESKERKDALLCLELLFDVLSK